MLESLESTWRGVLYLLVGASMRGSQGRGVVTVSPRLNVSGASLGGGNASLHASRVGDLIKDPTLVYALRSELRAWQCASLGLSGRNAMYFTSSCVSRSRSTVYLARCSRPLPRPQAPD